MNELQINCPACGNEESEHYISTDAHMHIGTIESYTFLKCGNCQSVYLTNRVSAKALANFYTPDYLPYRGASAWGIYAWFVERDQRSIDFARVKTCTRNMPLHKTSKVLDLGCGKPTFLQALYNKTSCSATGIDFTDNGWRGKEWNGLLLIEKDPTDFKPTHTFDLITAWHYMEHDYNPKNTLNNVARWLSPGGKLIIEVPDYRSLTAQLQGAFWEGWHAPRHTMLYTEKAFRELLPDTEWRITKYYRYGTLSAFTLWWMGWHERRKINWAASMEKNFWGLVALKIITAPLFLLERWIPLGIQTIIVERR